MRKRRQARVWRRGLQRALCPRCDLWELVSRIMYIIDFIICIAKRMPRNSKTARQRRELVQLYLSYNKYIMSQLLHTAPSPDRKSTRLNSSHVAISYAVF